jgi:hypothetical protein
MFIMKIALKCLQIALKSLSPMIASISYLKSKKQTLPRAFSTINFLPFTGYNYTGLSK